MDGDEVGAVVPTDVTVHGAGEPRVRRGEEAVLSVVFGEWVLQASTDWCTSPALAVWSGRQHLVLT